MIQFQRNNNHLITPLHTLTLTPFPVSTKEAGFTDGWVGSSAVAVEPLFSADLAATHSSECR